MALDKNKLALVSLYSQDNIGIISIASYLLSKGKDVINIYLGEQPQNKWQLLSRNAINNFIKLLKKEEVNLVGISFVSTFYKEAIRLSEIIRKEVGIKTIAGGFHASLCPEECIPYSDMVCIGEGEETLLEVVDRLENRHNLESVKGLCYKDNGNIIKNPNRPFIKDLDRIYANIDFKKIKSYSFIKDKITLIDNQQGVYNTVAAKGCPFSCTYCNSSSMHRIAVNPSEFFRKRSIDNVIEELIKAKKFFCSLKGIRFYNEIFPYFDKELDEFCEKYTRHINLPFIAYLHFNFITERVLRKLKEAGLYRLELGVQSGSERFRMEVFNRRESNQKIFEVTKLARQVGFPFRYDVILSKVLDTKETLKESIYFFLELGNDVYIKLLDLIYLPKTALTEKLMKEGLIEKTDQEQYLQKVLRSWHFNFLLLDIFDERTYFYFIIFLIRRTHLPTSFYKYLTENNNAINLLFVIFLILIYCFMHSFKRLLKSIIELLRHPNMDNFNKFIKRCKQAIFFLEPLKFSNA